MSKRFANEVRGSENEYFQKRIDEEYFKGYACLIKIKGVDKPMIINNDGFITCLLDENYEWLEIYPDNAKYAITVMFDDKGDLIEWYFDIAKNIGIENGIPYEDDLYLDILIKPDGEEIILDEDELKEALDKNNITKEEFDIAYVTMNEIKEMYVNNIDKLKELTNNLYKLLLVK